METRVKPRDVALLSLAMLAAVCFTFAGAVLLSRYSPVIPNHVKNELAKLEATNGLYYFDDGYTDEGDYVLLGQVEHADYSRGGVYFVGSSEMNTALMTWKLTPAERKLIHNYSIGDFRHTEAKHFLRMLVEDKNLLQAGPEKTTVILNLSFQLARKKEGEKYVSDLFRRHGFYTYDWDRGIHAVKMSPLKRQFILWRDEAQRLFNVLFLHPSRIRTNPDSRDFMFEHMRRVMEGDWQDTMAREVDQLGALIDYLQAHHVRVIAVFPPSGTWQDKLPYDAAYRAMVEAKLSARNVPLADFGDMLPDEDFMDAVHERYSGQAKIHESYRQLALKALADMGVEVQ